MEAADCVFCQILATPAFEERFLARMQELVDGGHMQPPEET